MFVQIVSSSCVGRPRSVRLILCILVLLVWAAPSAGDSGEWRAGFHLDGLGGDVWDSVVYDDGSGPALYVGGSFDAVGTQVVEDGHGASAGIVRWNGTSWSALPTPARRFGEPIEHLAVVDAPGGTVLYAAGQFLDQPRDRGLARWDGTTWTLIDLGPDIDRASIHDMVEWDDGSTVRLAVSGVLAPDGSQRTGSVWQLEGLTWTELGDIDGAFEIRLSSVALGGQPLLIAMGNIDSVTPPGGPTVGGLNGIARWDGTSWSSFGGGFPESFPYVEDAIVFDAGGGPSLYVGGGFRTNQGSPASRIARWTGTQWVGIGGVYPLGTVLDLQLHDDGSGPALFASGRFESLTDGRPTPGVARWDGSTWTVLDGSTELSESVSGLSSFQGSLFAEGSFDPPGAPPLARLGRWDGLAWNDVTPGSAAGQGVIERETLAALDVDPGTVDSLAEGDLGAGSRIFAVGRDLFRAGEADGDGVLQWDGTSWSTLPNSELPSGSIEALAIFDDGGGPAAYIGGSFVTGPQGQTLNRIAKLGANGWEPLDDGSGTVGVVGTVNALDVFDGGTGAVLAVGGGISSAGSLPLEGLAFWDGASWQTPSPSLEDDSGLARVEDLEVLGSRLVVGGLFDRAGALTLNHIALWDGLQWIALDDGSQVGVPTSQILALGANEVGGDELICGLHGGAEPPVDCWDGSSWMRVADSSVANVSITELAVIERFDRPRLIAGGQPLNGAPISLLLELDDGSWEALGPPTSVSGRVDEILVSGESVWVGGQDFDRLGNVASSLIGVLDPCVGPCAILFSDGFESGDVSAWSAGVP